MLVFTENEITKGVWIKISENGHAFYDYLNPIGTVKEGGLFNRADSWEGKWRITNEGKQLEIIVGEYSLSVQPAMGNIYAGQESLQDEDTIKYFRFKLIHLKDDYF